jgi:hypothetical protein
LVLLAGGCGKKMTPLSPDKVLPGPVREFRVSQEGESLVLSWFIPRENQLGQPLTQLQGCRLYRAEDKGVQARAACVTDFVLLAEIDLAYSKVGEVQGEALVFQDKNLLPDRRYWYRVAAYDQEGYLGKWSPIVTHAWGLLPRPPQDLKAQAGDRAVRLSWPAVTQLTSGGPLLDLGGYRVYRRSGEGAWLRVTPEPISQTDFQDVAVLNEVEYNYQVRAVRRVGPEWLESLPSPTRAALPEKLTPPPPLLNLVAVGGAEGVELRWDPSPSPDLAGYRVYRRGPGEADFVRLTPALVKRPMFVDTRVERGKTYHYYVTAVDDSRRANESLPSEEAGLTY